MFGASLQHFAGSPQLARTLNAASGIGVANFGAWGLAAGAVTVRRQPPPRAGRAYLRCLLMILVISNIDTCALPKISLSFSSALIMRLLMASCRFFFWMYSQLSSPPRYAAAA